ncbi:hypothetical protein PFFVO_05573 [Plasmodium falciparum Vietnam Oak-Knoll (FVO)]|nr:hypothetical protein PFFVO_05573 [Plasmodium falciparum Vietnam Oak-Knoll (FVO)]
MKDINKMKDNNTIIIKNNHNDKIYVHTFSHHNQICLFSHIHSKLIDHLKIRHNKLLIFKKILEVYLIEITNFAKYQKKYNKNKINLFINSACPYELLLFSSLIKCNILCNVSIRNICNSLHKQTFQKKQSIYNIFLSNKIKNKILTSIKKSVVPTNDIIVKSPKLILNNLHINKNCHMNKLKTYQVTNSNFFNMKQINNKNKKKLSYNNLNNYSNILQKQNYYNIKHIQKKKKKKKLCKLKNIKNIFMPKKKNSCLLSNIITNNNTYIFSKLNNKVIINYKHALDTLKNIRKTIQINSKHSQYNIQNQMNNLTNHPTNHKEKQIQMGKKETNNDFKKSNHKINCIFMTQKNKKYIVKKKIEDLQNQIKSYELKDKKMYKSNKLNRGNHNICDQNEIEDTNKCYNNNNDDDTYKNYNNDDTYKNYNNDNTYKNYNDDDHGNHESVKCTENKTNNEKSHSIKDNKIIQENIKKIKDFEKKYKSIQDNKNKTKYIKQQREFKLKINTRNKNIKLLQTKKLKNVHIKNYKKINKKNFISIIHADKKGNNTRIKFKINNENFNHPKIIEEKKKITYIKNKKCGTQLVNTTSKLLQHNNTCNNQKIEEKNDIIYNNQKNILTCKYSNTFSTKNKQNNNYHKNHFINLLSQTNKNKVLSSNSCVKYKLSDFSNKYKNNIFNEEKCSVLSKKDNIHTNHNHQTYDITNKISKNKYYNNNTSENYNNILEYYNKHKHISHNDNYIYNQHEDNILYNSSNSMESINNKKGTRIKNVKFQNQYFFF